MTKLTLETSVCLSRTIIVFVSAKYRNFKRNNTKRENG